MPVTIITTTFDYSCPKDEQMAEESRSVNSTIEERLARAVGALTPLERVLAGYLTRNFPVAGLSSMPQLAKDAGVSAPTVLRLVQKLGFRGYPEFQTQLRAEVEARFESPLAKRARWSDGVPQSHILNRFADAVLTNLSVTLGRIDHAEFDACAAMLADERQKIYVVGGRITHALAEYLVTQLGIVRPGVAVMPALPRAWSPVLLDLRKGDVLIVLDIRRYESSVLQLSELARERGAEIVLITDPWLSPVSNVARFRFAAEIEVPSAWDSSVALLVLLETLLAAVQEHTWPQTECRLKSVEGIYESTGLFRRAKPGDSRRVLFAGAGKSPLDHEGSD